AIPAAQPSPGTARPAQRSSSPRKPGIQRPLRPKRECVAPSERPPPRSLAQEKTTKKPAIGRLIWCARKGERVLPAKHRFAQVRTPAASRRAGNPTGTKKPAIGRLIWCARKGERLLPAKHRFAQVRTPAASRRAGNPTGTKK